MSEARRRVALYLYARYRIGQLNVLISFFRPVKGAVVPLKAQSSPRVLWGGFVSQRVWKWVSYPNSESLSAFQGAKTTCDNTTSLLRKDRPDVAGPPYGEHFANGAFISVKNSSTSQPKISGFFPGIPPSCPYGNASLHPRILPPPGRILVSLYRLRAWRLQNGFRSKLSHCSWNVWLSVGV